MDSIDQRIQALGGEGIVTRADLKSFSDSVLRVFMLMSDGEWHDADAIRGAAGENGVPTSEGLRRMRELRKLFAVESYRPGTSRMFLYRLQMRGMNAWQK